MASFANLHKLSFLLATAAAMSGCALVKGPAFVEWPWKDSPPCTDATSCSLKEAFSAGSAAINFCRNLQLYYENGGRGSDAMRIGVGTFGALAGAVFAPISHGSAATAWSGVSGAMNATQVQMDEAFSSSVSTQRRAAISEHIKSQHAGLATGTNEERVAAAMSMAALCAGAPAEADQKMLKQLAN